MAYAHSSHGQPAAVDAQSAAPPSHDGPFASPADSPRVAPGKSSSGSPLLAVLSCLAVAVPDRRETSQLDEFLAADDPADALAMWVGADALRRYDGSFKSLSRQLDRDIAAIDAMISRQLSTVMHHPSFQRLEAAWSGLAHLVNCRSRYLDAPVFIRVLNVAWAELRSDLEGAAEFDQSQFFRKVYEEGIGQAGASPMSAILTDFAIHPRPTRAHPFDDMSILQRLSETAAAAFAPLFINASPAMLGVDNFSDLRQAMNLERVHEKADFARWRRFRDAEESRFVSLVMPRILMRPAYRRRQSIGLRFFFEEQVDTQEDMLWGGAVWGAGEVLIRNFAQSRWFANIRGVVRGADSGGLVTGPCYEAFDTEPGQAAPKAIVDVCVSDFLERQVARLGFLSLCATRFAPAAAFYSSVSAQKPRRYTAAEATANAELSALTNYILCASRFAHYVKVITRDLIGGQLEAGEVQHRLNEWLMNYVNRDPEAGHRMRAEKPLIDADVQVRPIIGRAGEYDCILKLAPYHSFDDVQANLKMDTKLVSRKKD